MMMIVIIGRIQIHGVLIENGRLLFLEIVSRSNCKLNEITVSNKDRTFYFFITPLCVRHHMPEQHLLVPLSTAADTLRWLGLEDRLGLDFYC